MTFNEQNQYPFPADTVIQVFADKDYFLEKYRLSGASNIQLLEDTRDADHSRIVTQRDVDIDINVPAFARKFVPDVVTLIQTDAWDRRRKTGQLDIRFKGVPAEVHCDMTLTGHDHQSTLDLNFSVRVGVPMIGDKLASVLARDLKTKFQRDARHAEQVMGQIAERYR
ncbi:DUF2505 domain-containing protein [Alloalcanivorax gelatiniphagus]|uniref:DUF2505 domain-containing protein n=1 Tax=Alloalcanivorax gelatiniphagus TaxID=1194167 RepID=A0ABY2XK52_9GAMM|nr:DUF2505 domain-containing protein [Alloalcanivorax gelatiniphagus]TMW12378.1 DUF2505 domain-containing protein [Alloalcanivorax gelatiniphagus]|tara:strand:- start:8920 stop:9423 length:504 start_codon:yes stop_codon:yes gene_type:complete